MEAFYIIISVAGFAGALLCLILGLVGTLFGWCREFNEWIGRRGWRYSTRELFIVITVVAVVFALIGVFIQ